MKFYYINNHNYYGHKPFFICGNDYGYATEYFTEDINLANFMCIYFPNDYTKNNQIEVINSLINNKIKNPNIKLIILNKDELLYDYSYNFIKSVRDTGYFSKDELFVASPNINVIENNLYTHFPAKLWPVQFLHRWRNLIPTNIINQIEKTILNKNKKIIVSSRKWNLFRNFLFQEITNNYPQLINNENIIRYYGMLPGNDYANEGAISNKFNQNKNIQKVSSFEMTENEEAFYEDLLTEYIDTYFTIVNETFPHTTTIYNSFNEFQVSEKTLIPMVTRNIFFLNSKSNFENLLEQTGVLTFEEDFGIYYDMLAPNDKIKKLLSILKKINNMDISDINDFYNQKTIQEKLEHNFNFVKYWKNQNNCILEYNNFLKQFI
jgi:hypothetical protein